MSAFTDFVNTELPKRVSTEEDGSGSGNLTAGKYLRTTGIGLGVETVDINTIVQEPAKVIKEAGEDISVGNVVILNTDNKVYKADKDTVAHAKQILGVVVGSVTTGNNATVQIEGELNGLSGLTGGEVTWLGNNGTLTNIAPTSGFLVKIGQSITSSIMIIDIEEPIIRI